MSPVPASTCPYCGGSNEAWTSTDPDAPASPEPGDWTLCLGCGGLLVFALDLTTREPDEHELGQMIKDPGVRRAQAIVRLYRREVHDGPTPG